MLLATCAAVIRLRPRAAHGTHALRLVECGGCLTLWSGGSVDSHRFEIESEAWYRAVAEGRLPAVTDRAVGRAAWSPDPPVPGPRPAFGRDTGSSPWFSPNRP